MFTLEELPQLKSEAAQLMKSAKNRKNYLENLAQQRPYSAFTIATAATKSAEFTKVVEELTEVVTAILSIQEIDDADPIAATLSDEGKIRKKYEDWEREVAVIQSAATRAVCQIQAQVTPAAPAPAAADAAAIAALQRSKPVPDLKPEKLTPEHTTALMLLWLDKVYGYFTASRFHLDALVVQQQTFFGLINPQLELILRSEVTPDMIVYPAEWNERKDKVSPSCFKLVITHWATSHPLIANRLKFFRHKQVDGQKYSSFMAAHQELSQGCDLTEMTPEDIYVMTVLAGCVDEELLDELLKANKGKPDHRRQLIEKTDEVEARRSASSAILGKGEVSALTAHQRKKQMAMAPASSSAPSFKKSDIPPAAKGKCFVCGSTSHLRSSCPDSVKSKVECTHCKSKGHHATVVCFSLMRKKPAKVSEVTTAGEGTTPAQQPPPPSSVPATVSAIEDSVQSLSMISGVLNPLDYD